MLEQALVLVWRNKTTISCRILSLQKPSLVGKELRNGFPPTNPRQGKCFIVRDELFKDLSSFFLPSSSCLNLDFVNASINYQCLVVSMFLETIRGGKRGT